jgi:hypothetical protein
MSKVIRASKGRRMRKEGGCALSKVSRVSNAFRGMHYFHMKDLQSWDLQ